MTLAGYGSLGVVSLAVSELAAWLAWVPGSITPQTFLWVNGLLVTMFAIGLASAANGPPTTSIAELLYETERSTPPR
jgi:hypothetical protein